MICGVPPRFVTVSPIPEGGQVTALSSVMLGSTQDMYKCAVLLASELASALGSMQMWFPHQQAVALPLNLQWILWFGQQLSAFFQAIFHVSFVLSNSGYPPPLLDPFWALSPLLSQVGFNDLEGLFHLVILCGILCAVEVLNASVKKEAFCCFNAWHYWD